jgi:RNA polymerase sigma-70 factor (ECF subfamily)
MIGGDQAFMMGLFPDTRASLILRLGDADARAWDEFVSIYQPVVYRMARRHGLQHADAEELVQEVLIAVSRAVGSWVPDAERGRFRAWLHRIARNLIVNYLTRPGHRAWSTGNSEMHRLLEAECDGGAAATQWFEIEYRREVLQRASEAVRRTVQDRTWRAFWLTTMDDLPIGEAARQLEMSVGGVYIARSRVMARLREEVRRIEAE